MLLQNSGVNMIRNIFRNFINKARDYFFERPKDETRTVTIPTPHVITPSADARRRARPPKVVRLLRTRQGETSGDHQ